MIKFRKRDFHRRAYLGTLHAGFVHFNVIPNLGECAHRIASEVIDHISGLPVTDEDVMMMGWPVLPDVYVTIVFNTAAADADNSVFVETPSNGKSLGSYEVGFNDPDHIRKFEIQGLTVRALHVKVDDWQLPLTDAFRRNVNITFYQSA